METANDVATAMAALVDLDALPPDQQTWESRRTHHDAEQRASQGSAALGASACFMASFAIAVPLLHGVAPELSRGAIFAFAALFACAASVIAYFLTPWHAEAIPKRTASCLWFDSIHVSDYEFVLQVAMADPVVARYCKAVLVQGRELNVAEYHAIALRWKESQQAIAVADKARRGHVARQDIAALRDEVAGA